jgi:hypothetical protein
MNQRFNEWIRELEAIHLADLTFAEVARALRALSSTYVERRGRLNEGAALSGAGKRAAFALFYGPLHFLLIHHIVADLNATADPSTLVDLGCGTGAAGAAWATACVRAPRLLGIDRHPWAVEAAARTYRCFGLTARTWLGDLAHARWPTPAAAVAAFALNELSESSRSKVVRRLVERGRRGESVLIVEPLAGFVAPWWKETAREIEAAGGRADEWRIRVELPEIVARLDRAAGLDHREITGRSLWIAGRQGATDKRRRGLKTCGVSRHVGAGFSRL